MTTNNLLIHQHESEILAFFRQALKEDIGPGDYTTLATVSPEHESVAVLYAKEEAFWAGNEVFKLLWSDYDPSMKIEFFKDDGDSIKPGEKVLQLKGRTQSILSLERLSLNLTQHLSGVVAKTRSMVQLIEGYHTRLLDTRKTTPGMRILEKWAVKLGGAENHRIGLYDMVMIKDNHIDQCGSLETAIERTIHYLEANKLNLRIEVETRNLDEVERVLAYPRVDWIMLDNFSDTDIPAALKLINGRTITEASGGINESNIVDYAKTGVDFISSGAITQKARAIDLSLKIVD